MILQYFSQSRKSYFAFGGGGGRGRWKEVTRFEKSECGSRFWQRGNTKKKKLKKKTSSRAPLMLEAAALARSGVGVATPPSWPPPGPALLACHSGAEKMAACGKVSERRGGRKGGDAHHCEPSHGPASRCSACAASQTDDGGGWSGGGGGSAGGWGGVLQERNEGALRQVDGAGACEGVKTPLVLASPQITRFTPALWAKICSGAKGNLAALCDLSQERKGRF